MKKIIVIIKKKIKVWIQISKILTHCLKFDQNIKKIEKVKIIIRFIKKMKISFNNI